MPSGLDTENKSMTTVPTPSTRQNDVAIRMFFLAATRSSNRLRLPFSSAPVALPVLRGMLGDGLFCSMDLLMVRSRDVPHLKTARSTTMHMHTKATHVTLVAVCGCLATDRIDPTKAPMHTAQRVAYCPAGRSSASDIAMISGVSCISR